MRLYHQPQQADALAYAAGGGQALHLLGITPARLYDQDLKRLVDTARDGLGLRAVEVAHTGTPRQHVVIKGWPLVRAVAAAGEASNVILVDILTAAEGGDICQDCQQPIGRNKMHIGTGTGYVCEPCNRRLYPDYYKRRVAS